MSNRILFVTPEAYPLAKTGGLGDYSSGLTKALRRLGRDVRILMPGYPEAIERLGGDVARFDLGDRLGLGPTTLLGGEMPDGGCPVWLIDSPGLFARAGGLYQNSEGEDWPDNAWRFGLLSRVATWLAQGALPVAWRPDLVHLNEWQTGPAAAMLAQARRRVPTLFTIHSMAFHGVFEPHADLLRLLDLPGAFCPDGLEYFGNVSFLKAGIRFADRLATVSRAYAEEIQTAEFGCGLEGLVRRRAERLSGILNGVDYQVWDPIRDRHIAARFGAGAMDGKARCKAALKERFGLSTEQENTPVFAYVSHFTQQKMADVVIRAAPDILARGGQIVMLGCGERAYEAAVAELAQRFPGRFAASIGYSEELAHQILAGADVLLAPSRFEPCGLTQIYALRYGTVPIVTGVGGLKETVVDATADALASGIATGFVCVDRTRRGLLAAVERAAAMYRMPPVWRVLQVVGMGVEYPWARSARQYEAIYDDLAGRDEPAARPSVGRRRAATAWSSVAAAE